MNIDFLYPGYLWFLIAIPFLIGLAIYASQGVQPARFWVGLGLRTFLFLALILALAGVQLRFNPNMLTTVFVLDVSDSISPPQRQKGEELIRQAISEIATPGLTDSARNEAAVILFGENALVERLASDENTLSKLTSIPITTRTDISSALQLAQAVFPGEGQKRIVLLSDGRENLGKAVDQAELAAASQIALDYVKLGDTESTAEVWLEALDTPAEIRKGQEIELTARIASTVLTNASLRIFENETLVQSLDLRLLPGTNQIQIPLKTEPLDPGGNFLRFKAQVIPDNDTRLQNNEARAFTVVLGPPAVLVLAEEPDKAEALVTVLRQAQMKVNLLTPDQMPTTLGQLAEYECVILVDVPAASLPAGVMEILQVATRDLGKGLLMIGGDHSFGAGGYLRTPLEKALPVDMDVRDKEIQSNLALILAVDKSGSMGRCHCDNPDLFQTYTPSETGQAKVDIAKEAVMRASAALGDQDYLGVLAFDAQPRWALELSQHVDTVALENAISVIQANGQTNLQAGVEAAFQALQNVQARRKHIILMTDGWVRTGDLTYLTQEMKSKGVTLSIVAAGKGSAEYLKALATLGGGEFYPAQNIQNVPDIFLKETIKSVGQYIIEEPFLPIQTAPSPVMSGLDPANLPPLLGYNGTTAKKASRLDLVTNRGDPLLASWQYGLGRSAVWTSDLKGQWATLWLNWEGFPRFVSQLVSWTLPAQRSQGLSIEAGLKDNRAVVSVHAAQPDGTPFNFLTGTAMLVDPELETVELPLKQIGPGEYEASAEVSTPGVYLLRVGVNDQDRSLGQSTLGLVVPYSPEYRFGATDQSLLSRLASLTGGRELRPTGISNAFEHNLPSVPSARPIWLPLLLIAALLFPIDVALRRLVVKKRDFQMAIGWIKSRLSQKSQDGTPRPYLLGNLFEARQRARLQTDRKPEETQKAKKPQKTTKTAEIKTPDIKPPQPVETPQAEEPADSLSRLREAKKRAKR